METPVASPPALTIEGRPTLVRGLTLLDSVLLLVGGVIGSSIFLTAKDIAGPLPHPALFLLVWVLGGLISMCACFAFAELGTMFPDSGGQYVYMREAYGDLPAFLYGWTMFSVGNGGSIAALAVGSAAYLGGIVPAISQSHVVLSVAGMVVTRAQIAALLMIVVVTWINIVGLRWGAMLQNVATWAKFGAMGAFVILGFAIGKGEWHHFTGKGWGTVSGLTTGMGAGQLLSAFGVALIAVFWAYDGWVYIGWVAGEIKDPRRNVPLALVLGVTIVGIIYVAMNMAYLYALPITEIAKHETIAHAAATALFSPTAAVWLSALIAVSCFGALACAILSAARVYYAMALDGLFFRRMAEVHPKWRTPAFALIGQAVWAGILTLSGRYDQLYTYVIFASAILYGMATASVIVLRFRRPDMPRPYRTLGYPVVPIAFVLGIACLIASTLRSSPRESVLGLLLIALGLPFYFYWKKRASV